MQHPVQILRNYFANHSELSAFSTQKGFGNLIGKSDAFVRGLEQGAKPVTTKIAKLIETRTGVCSTWLTALRDENEAIPAAGGEVLTHEIVISQVRAQNRSNFESATAIGGEEMLDALWEILKKPMLNKLRAGDGTLIAQLAVLAYSAQSAPPSQVSPE